VQIEHALTAVGSGQTSLGIKGILALFFFFFFFLVFFVCYRGGSNSLLWSVLICTDGWARQIFAKLARAINFGFFFD